MNKKLITLCAALAAVVLAGCQKEKESEPVYAGPTHTVTFTAEKILDSKTGIASEADGIVSYKWISGDEERMHISESYLDGETAKTNQGTNVTMSPSADGKTATFVVTFEGEAPSGEVTYNAVYAGSVSKAGNALIPSVQHPAADSFDPAADVMVADPIVKSARDENPSFRFLMNRKVSVNKMTLKGLTAGEIVSSVTFESDKSHSAYYVLNPKEGNSSYTANGKKLSFVYTADNEIPTSGEFPVYFTTAPVEGATFTVRVVTDKAVYEKTSTKTIDFACGSVRRFGVNLAGCREEITTGDGFTLISSTEDIPTSCEVLIVGDIVGEDGSSYYAMGEQKTNNRGAVAVPAPDSNNTITLESTSEAHIFVMEQTTSGYTFKEKIEGEDYYLYPGSSTENRLKSKSTLDELCYWNISISNGVASVVGKSSTNTRNNMRFNKNLQSGIPNPLFNCFASTSTTGTSVSIYSNSQSAVIDSRVDPDFSFENEKIEFRIDDTAARTDFGSGQELTNPQNLSVTWSSSNTDIATVDANGNVTIADGAYGSVTITATFAGNETYKPATASYTLVIGSTVALAIENKGEHVLLEATVYAAIGGDNEYEAFIVGDETAKLFCYKKGHGLSIGDVVRLEGSTSIYAQSGVYELSPETITKIGHVDSVDHGTARDYDANASELVTIFTEKENRSASSHSAWYVHVTGTQVKRIITTTGNNKVREYIKEADVADLNADVDIYAYAYDLSAEASANLMNILVVSKTIVGQRDPAGISYDTASYDLTIGEASYTGFTAPTLTNPNNLTDITYESSNTSIAVVDASTGAVTLQGTAGTATITASFAGDESYTAGTASYTITVRNPVAPATDGDILWQDDFTGYSSTYFPSSVTDSHVYGGDVVGYALVNGESETKVYNENNATGTAPELLISKNGGSFTVSGIPAAGATSMTLTFKSNNSNWAVSSSTSGITVGTPAVNGKVVTVTISATSAVSTFDLAFTNSSGSNTRVDDFVLVVGVPPVTLSSIAVSGQTLSFTVGDTFVFDGTVTATYSDGSTEDVTSLASVSNPNMSTQGQKTVTVSYTEDGVTKTTSYTITVGTGGGSETMTFSSLYSSNTVLDGTVINGSNFTVTFNKRSGGTATQYYTNGYAVRWYGGGTLLVSGKSGKKITGVVINFTQTANSISASSGTYSLANNVGTWSGNASSVTFTQSGTSGQCRISSIEVSYSN